MEMEYIAISYLIVCAFIALFNPFSLKGNGFGRYIARFLVCIVSTPFFYFFLLGSMVTTQIDPKEQRKNWNIHQS
jgi:hypothetical protein